MRLSIPNLYRIPVILLVMFVMISGCKATFSSTDTSSSKEMPVSSAKTDFKKYDQVIPSDAETDEGLFTIHKVKDEYFFEIPDSLLDREMLLVSRISGFTQNLTFGGAGQKAKSQQVVRWQRKEGKVLLRHVSYSSVADPDDPVYTSVKNNNFEPVIFSFSIEALNEDSTGVVIEVTDLYTDDVALLSGLSDNQRSEFKVRRLDGGRTFVERMSSYPKNLEVRHVLTYDASNPPDDQSTNTISLEMNQSMILLPAEEAMPRLEDRRVGYFNISQYNYSLDEQKAAERDFITRWKLVPKDKEAYLRGELVEPVEPIVYYVGPGTPMKWRKYIKQGIDDWQVAFEEAGFKNAIIGKYPPGKEEDPEFSPEDVRYSVIRYITNPIQNASGPRVHDPRTGQILESDILWYHNVMNLLRNWFFIQTAAANPDARATKFDDEIMGQLIRFVSAHEVGHTLGLPHNWGSSYAYPVDSLRSPSFTSTHGTAPSIMDYARFNYIAQPGDGVENFYPAIGEYDKWAIKWGYTWFPDIEKPEDESEILNEWVVERADDPVYFYGTPGNVDPRSWREDLGDDAMKAGEFGLANLEFITENLIDWIEKPGETYDDLEELYGQILVQWERYMGHVVLNIGGVYENDKTFDQEGVVYSTVPEATQRRAMEFLNKHAFSTPTWAFNREILDRVNEATAVEIFRDVQADVLDMLLDPLRIGRIIDYEAREKGDTYTVFEMMDEARNGIWSEVRNRQNVGVHRRYLQRAYLDRMEYLMEGDYPDSFSSRVNASQSEIKPVVRNELEILKRDLDRALRAGGFDRATRVHFEDASARIANILDPED